MDGSNRPGTGGSHRARGRGRGRARRISNSAHGPGGEPEHHNSGSNPDYKGGSGNTVSNTPRGDQEARRGYYRGRGRGLRGSGWNAPRKSARTFDEAQILIKPTMATKASPEVAAILADLKEIPRREDKGAKFKEILIHEYYHKHPNPYSLGLELARFSHDVAVKNPHSMASTILLVLRTWLADEKSDGTTVRERFSELVTQELQDNAFVLAISFHGYFLHNLVSIYRLDKVANPGRYVPSIRKLMFNDKIHLALSCVSSLKLFPFLKFASEIVFPAMLCGQMKFSEEMMKEVPDQRLILANLLNQALSVKYNNWEAFVFQYNVPKQKEIKYSVKDALGKQLYKMKEKFGLPEEVTLNLPEWQVEIRNNQIRSVLIYMAARRSRDELSEVQWTEAIDFILSQCPPDIRKFFIIHLLSKRRDIQEAAIWTRRLGISPNSYDCPPEVRSFLQNNPYLDISVPPPDPFEPLNDCLTLPSDCPVSFISTEVGLEELGSRLKGLSSDDLVGLDVEWMPWEFGFPSKPKAILMQLALRDSVFLIDVSEQSRAYSPRTWASFIQSLFSSSCKKLGWDFQGDLIYLRSTFPTVPIELDVSSRMYCLSALVKQLWHTDPSFVVLPEKEKKTNQSPPKDNKKKPDEGKNSESQAVSKAQTKASAAESEEKGGPEEAKEPDTPKVQQIGLAAACRFFLGKQLDKREQMSHWGRRPLREAQVQYAALDAHSMISIYDEVKRRAIERGLNFQQAENDSMIKSA